MSALSGARDTKQRGSGPLPTKGGAPVAASTHVYQASLAALDSAGRLVPASASPGLVVVGRARADYDNSAGAAGAINGEWENGVFRWANSSSTDAITAAHSGRACFAVDDQTVSLTDGGGVRPYAGIIWDVDSAGVWVLTGPSPALAERLPSAPPTVSAAGAIPVGARYVLLSVDATKAYTLADGLFVGQLLTVVVIVGTNTPVGTVTPATKLAGAGIVAALGGIGDFATWCWQGAAGWVVVESQGVTIT